MKRLSIIIVVLFSSPVWALTFMGPPTSNANKGDLLLGFDYSNSETDIKLSGYGEKGTLKDVESDLFLGKVGLGLFDRFELFGRFGISEIEDTGNEFAWGVGTKATLWHKDAFSLGALFQVTALTADDEYLDWDNLLIWDQDLDIYDFQVTVGPSYEMDNLCLYGGPFLHFIEGDYEERSGAIKFSFDVEQESEIGGYIGLGWQFAENSSLNVEYQLTGDAQAIGISLLYRYGAPLKPAKYVVTNRSKPEPKPKRKPRVDATGRKIMSYRTKQDASGNFAKAKDGSFIFMPADEDKQEKTR